MVRMMVAVSLKQHLHRHAEKACSLPWVGPALHQPNRRGVSKHVRRYISSKTRIAAPQMAPARVPV